MAKEAWVTVVTNDTYGLGALVLGSSLRRVGTTRDTVVMVTPGVSERMREELSRVYTSVVAVDVLDSGDSANLALMARPELGVTFTKLHAWTLVQYSKCVFLDADTLLVQNCDELFEREELSAAPDPGWPDCFNSGVFVFVPSMVTYQALLDFAVAHGSFDGGDQGLLNMFFREWATQDINKHLPFIYNVVASMTYTYAPALKFFGSQIKIVHFLGSSKPWTKQAEASSLPYQRAWWNIFREDVSSHLSQEMNGVAGALARGDSDQWRKEAWEAGDVDYLGRDSFDNIWQRICECVGITSQGQTPQTVPDAETSAKSVVLSETSEQPAVPKDAPVQTVTTEKPSESTLHSGSITETSAQSSIPSENIEQSVVSLDASALADTPKSTDLSSPAAEPLVAPAQPSTPAESPLAISEIPKSLQELTHPPIISETPTQLAESKKEVAADPSAPTEPSSQVVPTGPAAPTEPTAQPVSTGPTAPIEPVSQPPVPTAAEVQPVQPAVPVDAAAQPTAPAEAAPESPVSTEAIAQPPTTEPATQPPMTSEAIAAKPLPATEPVAQAPSTEQVAQAPSTETVAQAPSTETVAEVPSTETTAKPSTTEATIQPAENVTQPALPVEPPVQTAPLESPSSSTVPPVETAQPQATATVTLAETTLPQESPKLVADISAEASTAEVKAPQSAVAVIPVDTPPTPDKIQPPPTEESPKAPTPAVPVPLTEVTSSGIDKPSTLVEAKSLESPAQTPAPQNDEITAPAVQSKPAEGENTKANESSVVTTETTKCSIKPEECCGKPEDCSVTPLPSDQGKEAVCPKPGKKPKETPKLPAPSADVQKSQEPPVSSSEGAICPKEPGTPTVTPPSVPTSPIAADVPEVSKLQATPSQPSTPPASGSEPSEPPVPPKRKQGKNGKPTSKGVKK